MAGSLDTEGLVLTRNNGVSTPRDHGTYRRKLPRGLETKAPCPIANRVARSHVQRAAWVPWFLEGLGPMVPGRRGPSRPRGSSASMDLGARRPSHLAVAVPMVPKRPGGQAAASDLAPPSHRPPWSPTLMGSLTLQVPRSHCAHSPHAAWSPVHRSSKVLDPPHPPWDLGTKLLLFNRFQGPIMSNKARSRSRLGPGGTMARMTTAYPAADG
jgi:hypothetical protein